MKGYKEQQWEAKICGTCRFNKHDGTDFYCCNDESGCCTEYMRYGDSCEGWQAKTLRLGKGVAHA